MKKALVALATAAALITISAAANDLVIIFNDLNPTPKAAFEKVVDDFKAANPDINVELSIMTVRRTSLLSATSRQPVHRM